MRTYQVRLSSNLKATVNQPRVGDNVLDLIKAVKRGHWLKDTDGEYLNPAHVISIKLAKEN